jgi:hypothetical protein
MDHIIPEVLPQVARTGSCRGPDSSIGGGRQVVTHVDAPLMLFIGAPKAHILLMFG